MSPRVVLCYTTAMKRTDGYTLIEVVVAVAIFLLFAVGIYGALTFVFKIVYLSRLTILETALVSEELEVARNLPFDSVGIVNGIPVGVLQYNKTVTRNGVVFSVTTTVRNIDDTFDGTLGGAPNDTAPADYKLVEVAAQCISCPMRKTVTLSTQVAPKNLEGASSNGALFINVFDALGLPVSDASVHVVDTAITPNIVIDDVTDNAGYLRIIDAPTGTMSYRITVTKNGYSTDFTTSSSVTNPNPVKPPANVVSRSVTNLSFAIDQLGALTVHTLNPLCAVIPTQAFSLHGAKYIGTSPTVYKYSANLTSDAGGAKALSSVEWDTYTPSIATTYDIAGTIPMSPWTIAPTMNQDASILLVPHTSRSLLVKVKDAGTGLPLSNATVSLSGSSYDETSVTGLGYTRQTDWSGGSGQASLVDDSKYFSDDGSIENASPAGDVTLKRIGLNYITSGWLESSTFDIGAAVDFNNVIFDANAIVAQVGPQAVLLQVATSNSSTPTAWDFTGPDGTIATYYTPTSTLLHSSLSGKRYVRYRLYLATTNQSYSPQVSEIIFTYTTSCGAPGQSFFSGMSAGTYTLDISRSGYTSYSGSVVISSTTEAVVNMSP